MTLRLHATKIASSLQAQIFKKYAKKQHTTETFQAEIAFNRALSAITVTSIEHNNGK